MALKITTPPADDAMVVSVEEFREQSGQDGINVDDKLVRRLIQAVTSWLAGPQGWLGRSLVEQTLTLIVPLGVAGFVHMLGASISAHFLAFDDLLPEAPALFRGVRRQYRREMEARGLADIAPREAEFVIAGYSAARDRVEAYGMHSRAWNGGEPWALVPIRAFSV